MENRSELRVTIFDFLIYILIKFDSRPQGRTNFACLFVFLMWCLNQIERDFGCTFFFHFLHIPGHFMKLCSSDSTFSQATRINPSGRIYGSIPSMIYEETALLLKI